MILRHREKGTERAALDGIAPQFLGRTTESSLLPAS